MKTLFIMLSRAIVARNILRTEVLTTLLEHKDLRIVICTPPNIPSYFRDECNHPNIILEETNDISGGIFRRKIFNELFTNLSYTATSKFMNEHSGRINKGVKRKQHHRLSNYFLDPLYTIISRITILKTLFRFLDSFLFPDTDFDRLFQKYAPDLVFCATIISKKDVAMVKAARRYGVPTVGMTRGWDNLARLLLPIVPNTLLVQNSPMVDMAQRYHAIPKHQVNVVGFPQFDIYHDETVYESREIFLGKLGIDPSHKVIFYASEGQWAPHDEFIVRKLYDMVVNNKFNQPTHLIIRPHFSDVAEGKFNEFIGKSRVHVDTNFRTSTFFTDPWDPSVEEMRYLANELRHLDIMITMASTLSLEAALFDKPIINIDFYDEGEPDRDLYFGRWYQSTHYQGVVETGGVQMVHSYEELTGAINEYLNNPKKDSENRKKLAHQYCHSINGGSGKHIANLLLKKLKIID